MSVTIRSAAPQFAGWCALLAVPLALASLALAVAEEENSSPMPGKHIIGATAIITEVSTGLEFEARVDTGAKSCSMHVEKIEITNESEEPRDNVGKAIRILVKNNQDKSAWIETIIAGHVIVKTADERNRRYKVRLRLQWNDMKKEVLVTLNDRSSMTYPMLIGRNFLRGGFLVDVDIDNND